MGLSGGALFRLGSDMVVEQRTVRPTHGGNLAWAAGVAGCEPEGVLDFSASISPLGSPRAVADAIQGAIATLSAYPNPDYQQLRQVLGAWHGVAADWVLPGNGAAELITWAGRELAGRERVYALAPGFADYGRAVRAFGAVLEPWPISLLVAEGKGLEALAGRLRTEDGVWLNNPHNPTGQLFGRDAILPLLATGALVVVDEAFMDFVEPGRQETVIDWVGQFENLVVLRSLTKFYCLPGLRLGYAIAQPERLQRWQQWRDPWPVNALAEAAAIAAVQAVAFQQKTWDWLGPARQALFEGLGQIEGLEPLPGAANFLLVRCEASVVVLQEQLLKQHHILIRDCLSFKELGDHYFRVAVRLQEENERLMGAIAQELPPLLEPALASAESGRLER